MKNRTRMFVILGAMLLAALIVMLSVSTVGASPSNDAAKGKTAYDKNCAVCHGEAGKGGIGPPLAKDVSYFVNAGVPAQMAGPLLTQSLRQRPPGSKMPAFAPNQLSDAEVIDIGDYLFSLTPAPAAAPKLGTAENGAKPYADNCAACHGAKGEGGGGPAVAMMAAGMKQMGAPPSVMLGFVNLATRSGSMPSMPTFAADKLSDAQLADIAAYIWSIAPTGAPAGPAPGAAPAKTSAPAATTLPKSGEPTVPYQYILPVALLVLIGGVAIRSRLRKA